MHRVGQGSLRDGRPATKAASAPRSPPLSLIWFTLSHGVLNEIYYPRVDQACTRDFGLLVADGHGFFAEEKRDTFSEVSRFVDGVPAFALRNTHATATGEPPRFRIHKRIIADPRREVVLQDIRLENLGPTPLQLYALLAPHLVNGGNNNRAWIGDYKGQPMLFAEGHGTSLALACSRPWLARSVGFTGISDGWQDISRHFRMEWSYDRAMDGNVALTGQLPADDHTVLALGFGRSPAEAAYRARSSLLDDFDTLADEYTRNWRGWQAGLRPLDRHCRGHNTYRISTAVMRAHESPSFPGGLIASLSIPWGAAKGDDDLGGYHLVWPRDLVETAGGLLAAGADAEAIRVLDYLRATQEPDGDWPQNAWLDGTPYWGGVQMDECAFPILLVEMALRLGALPAARAGEYWPMVRAAAGFVVRNGPVTGQDRWEEDAGYSPFTLAVEISALLAAAELAEPHDPAAATFLRETADAWNDALEGWTYASGSRLATAAGADGFYVRISTPKLPMAEADLNTPVAVKNRPDGEGLLPACEMVATDALALVRFGLRAADDPRMLATLKVIDHALKVELPAGPAWHRYNQDGYGEHADGAPFDGTGIGRLWPLLTGERAHYALAAGDPAQANALLEAMEACGSAGFMLPEQVWDSANIPAHELRLGRPSGSAMPLVWAHSEHVKLLRSLADGAVFDLPPQTVQRYQVQRQRARVQPWRPEFQPAALPAGRALRVELPEPATVRWTSDGWATMHDQPTVDTGLGVHAAELPTESMASGEHVVFTWFAHDGGAWNGSDVHLPVS